MKTDNQKLTSSYIEIERMAAALNIPLYAHVELTYTCNFRCIHCYLHTNTDRKELSTKQIIQILDQLAEQGTLYLALTGGEILYRKDFYEIQSIQWVMRTTAIL